MNNTVALLKSRNYSFAFLVSGQAVAALANVGFGKLAALYISPTEWGNYSLLAAFMMLLHGLLVTPTIQSFKASLLAGKSVAIINFYSHLLGIVYSLLLPVFIILTLKHGAHVVWLFVWLTVVGQGIYTFSNDYLNLNAQHKTYSRLMVFYACGNLVFFGLIVLVGNEPTALGLWKMLALHNGLFALLSICKSKRFNPDFQFRIQSITNWFSPKLLRSYRHYVWPLMSLAGVNWLIQYADRYLIKLYLTDADVGQYAVGYSLGSKVLLMVAPLIAFLSPTVFQLKANGRPAQEAIDFLLIYLKRYALVGVGLCACFFCVYQWVGQLFLSATYESSFIVAPIVATGYLFLTCIQLLEIKWYAYGQTHFMLWHNVVGAISNILLNLILIPRMGILGAALASLLGFGLQFLVVFGIFFRKH
ncbi:hypothetical protein GCM10028807_58310 [Spirosoma daeguense]